MPRTTVLLTDDHAIVAEGLATLLNSHVALPPTTAAMPHPAGQLVPRPWMLIASIGSCALGPAWMCRSRSHPASGLAHISHRVSNIGPPPHYVSPSIIG
jgi:hypothetical protein